MEIEFNPDLTHCIQTLAKNEYDQTMHQLFKAGSETPELGEKLEIIKLFLESTDFTKLRGEYEPHLVQGKKVTFTLYTQTNTTKYRMEIK